MSEGPGIPQTDSYWDEPGSFSIVVQGGLFGGNAVETARHCRHWRDLFPNAQIILAISVSDMFATEVRPGILVEPRLAKAFRENTHFKAVMARIAETCDVVVLSRGALPLPPIKTFSSAANNVNLQIVAAQAGLALATGRHVLRVRSDLVFADRDFIAQYAAANLISYGSAKVTGERVLISPIYTLNPFTYERMPLHFSDWFHLGLTEDVREIWAGPEMTFADAIYFKTHEAAPGSNKDELVFVPRRAVEQHMLYHYFKPRIPSLVVDHHNDLTSVELSLDILVDNFAICDLVRARCVFDKYAHDMDNPAKWLHCITPSDWTAMAHVTGRERRAVLEDKRLAVTNPETAPFPRHYGVRALSTKVGHRSRAEIIGSSVDGVLIHGPYDTLPEGQYIAKVQATVLEGAGTIDLAVTRDAGRETLAARQITFDGNIIPQLEIPFEVDTDVATRVEVVVMIKDITTLIVASATIAIRRDDPQDQGTRSFSATASPMQSKVGVIRNGRVNTADEAGHLLYGPYISLVKGMHRITLTVPHGNRAGKSFVEILSAPDQRLLLKQRIQQSDLLAGNVRCEFYADDALTSVETRVSVDRSASFAVSDVTFDYLGL